MEVELAAGRDGKILHLHVDSAGPYLKANVFACPYCPFRKENRYRYHAEDLLGNEPIRRLIRSLEG